MKRYVLMFEYDSKKFMDINKIILFKKNLEKIEEKENCIKMVFYGDASNEEFATFMSYFNSLIQKEICNLSISFRTKELVIEKGINNKSIKLSAKNAKEIKNKKAIRQHNISRLQTVLKWVDFFFFQSPFMPF